MSICFRSHVFDLAPVRLLATCQIVIFEGLHPMHDDRVNAALDLTVYLDITDDVKFAWKAQVPKAFFYPYFLSSDCFA